MYFIQIKINQKIIGFIYKFKLNKNKLNFYFYNIINIYIYIFKIIHFKKYK